MVQITFVFGQVALLKKHCHYCNIQMAKAKSDYYTNMVLNNSESPRQLWNYINQILHHRRPAPSLPNHVSIKSLYVTRSLVI